MRLLMKLIFLFCLLTVVYQYSQCSVLSKRSEAEHQSIRLPYSQVLQGLFTDCLEIVFSSDFRDRKTIRREGKTCSIQSCRWRRFNQRESLFEWQ